MSDSRQNSDAIISKINDLIQQSRNIRGEYGNISGGDSSSSKLNIDLGNISEIDRDLSKADDVLRQFRMIGGGDIGGCGCGSNPNPNEIIFGQSGGCGCSGPSSDSEKTEEGSGCGSKSYNRSNKIFSNISQRSQRGQMGGQMGGSSIKPMINMMNMKDIDAAIRDVDAILGMKMQ